MVFSSAICKLQTMYMDVWTPCSSKYTHWKSKMAERKLPFPAFLLAAVTPARSRDAAITTHVTRRTVITLLITLFLPSCHCQGSDVTTVVADPCDLEPCKNNATCAPSGDLGTYTCACAAGWAGKLCTEDVDECASSPCANGASCENGVNFFRCLCLLGYTGSLCKTYMDECSPDPCSNGGTCSSLRGGFSCTCPPGFNGPTCRIDIDECASSPCLHNGTCVDGVNGYTCTCDQYWTGTTCESDIDECALKSVPGCDKMTSCINSEGGYTCTCSQGYRGDGATCAFVNLCSGDPCAHGTCLSLTMNYTCVCDKGWKGDNCTEDVNECEPVMEACDAMYGECVNTPGHFRCQCRAGSHGNGFSCFRDTVYPLGTGGLHHSADTDRSAIYPVPGGLTYFGTRYYRVYASIDGHVSFSQDYLPPNPPGGATPRFPPGSAVVAPWWTDLDTTAGPGALWVDSYEPDDGSDVFGNVTADVRRYVGDVVNVTYVLVFTWKEVEPYPSYVSEGGKENATFQLVLATTNEQSYAIFNYNPDGPWFNMAADERRFLIGYSYGNGSDVTIALRSVIPGLQTNIGHNGRYFFTLGPPMAALGQDCLTWFRGQRSMGQRSVSPPCPCTRGQALLDTRFAVIDSETGSACADAVFPDSSGGRQRCCYRSDGSLQTGSPDGGSPILPEDADAKAACCDRSELCHLFYELRPSDDCRLYSAPRWGLAWGIGHYETVNGEQLTFNDRGMFTLFDQSSFTVQGRTDLVPSLLRDMMTTALVAVACKTSNSSVVEISSPALGQLSVMVDGLPSIIPKAYPGLTLRQRDNYSVLLQFASGEGLLVTAVADVLRVRLAVPLILPAATGLFTATPGGTQQQLSQYAAIPVNGSLFTSTMPGLPAGDFRFKDYVPADLSATIGELRKRGSENDTEPVSVCDGVLQCYYDYTATGGDIYRGVSAITERVRMLEKRRRLENLPPRFLPGMPSMLRVNVSQPVVLHVRALDPEGGPVTYNISTNLPPYDYVFVDSGYFRWVPASTNSTVYIQFSATDTEGATSVLWPQVRFCDCAASNVRSCDFDYLNILGMPSNDDRFSIASCPCLPGYTGRQCTSPADLCSPSPCYSAAYNACRPALGSMPHGVVCDSCPPGLSGNGLQCYDENECLRGTSKCSHECVNEPGSYSCSCMMGFSLQDDGGTCIDVDECTLSTHNCTGQGQYCRNLPGTFMCACKAKYFMGEKSCRRAPRRFGGSFVFQVLRRPSGETLTYSSAMENPQSSTFKLVAGMVQQKIDEIYSDVPGFIASQVTTLQSGSIVADYNLYMDESSTSDGATLHSTLREYLQGQGCTESGPICTVGQFVGVSLSQSSAKAKDLCRDGADNDCDVTSTNCSSHGDGTFSCSCRRGYKAWLDVNNICQDVNECDGYHGCDLDKAECVNTAGSYDCACKSSYRKLGSRCVPACMPNPCENKGDCYPDITTERRYTCRCKGTWSGPNCNLVNKHARRLEQTLIGVGVGLGLVCLILILIIVITCIRCRGRGSSDSDTEVSDRKVNDRVRNEKRTYSTGGGMGLDSWENNAHQVGEPPAAHHLRTTQFEMTENGSKQNLLSGGKEEPYSPRRVDPAPPANYHNGTGTPPSGPLGVENPSYAASPGEGGGKLDSQYF